MITIVDYGMGNLGSIHNMFKRLRVSSRVSGDPQVVAAAGKLLLPGVGSFDRAMESIEGRGLREVLDQKALKERVPVLGICLGMQLLTRSSEEGTLPGLGWIPAKTLRFAADSGLKVPHMGWNEVRPTRSSVLLEGLPERSRFYFVHSYFVKVEREEDSLLKAEYGIPFDAAIQRGNIYGAQFHPEKSHRFGMQLLRNFASL